MTVRRGTHTKSHTDSHSFSLSHLPTENAIVNIQRNRQRDWRGGGGGGAVRGVKEREDVEC